MAEDLQARLDQVDRAYIDGILEQVNSLTSSAQRQSADREALLEITRRVLALVTDPRLLQLLSEQLVEITNRSHQDFIAVARPAVGMLTFVPPKGGPDPARDASPAPIAGGAGDDEYDDLLEGTPAYDSYQVGKFLVVQNPYLVFDDLELAPNALNDARNSGRGGHLRNFNAEGPWAPDPLDISHLPKPSDTGSKTWYFETGKKPGSIPSSIPSTYTTKDKLRNVVKTVEVVYRRKGAVPGIETGEFVKETVDVVGGVTTTTTQIIPPGGGVVQGTTVTPIPGGTRTVTITRRTKLAHVIILYAGGNGS